MRLIIDVCYLYEGCVPLTVLCTSVCLLFTNVASLKATSKEPCVMAGHHFFQLNRVEVFLDAHSTEVLVLRSFLFLFILFSLGTLLLEEV